MITDSYSGDGKIGKRIKMRREELGLSQQELARRVGYTSAGSKSTINKIETGKNDVRQSMLPAYAKALFCTVEFLLGLGERSDSVRVPVYGEIAGGAPIEMIEDIEDYEEIPAEMARKGEYFALRIHGHSMAPRIENGDVVIFRKQSDAEDGDICAVTIENESATCKKIKYTDAGVVLVPLNPAYEPMFYSKKEVYELPLTIIGKGVEIRSKLS